MHLLVETPQANLGRGMQLLHGQYGRRHNDRHARSGHIFGGRYGCTRVTSDEQLWWTAAYVVRNPVKAGLCRTPEDWRWSSHSAAIGLRPAPSWLDVDRLRSYFGSAGPGPGDRYRDFVAGFADG
jgi:REP-associated tyrosine transposase